MNLSDKERILPKPIVCYEPKYVYYQIPKVACSTIKAQLAIGEGRDIVNGDPHDTPYRFITVDQAASVEHKEFFKFAFIRNPIDRLYSCWKDKICERLDLKRPKSIEADRGQLSKSFSRYNGLYRNMPFEEFAEYVCQVPDSDSEDHFISQYCYITSSKGDIIPYCFAFEDLQPSWNIISSELCLPKQLGHYQKTLNNEALSLHTSLKERLIKRYETDFKIWNSIRK